MHSTGSLFDVRQVEAGVNQSERYFGIYGDGLIDASLSDARQVEAGVNQKDII